MAHRKRTDPFFSERFDLSPEVMRTVFIKGYKEGVEVLNQSFSYALEASMRCIRSVKALWFLESSDLESASDPGRRCVSFS